VPAQIHLVSSPLPGHFLLILFYLVAGLFGFRPKTLPLPSKIFFCMANHKATKKDVRQATKRRDSNRYYGKTTRNAIRDFKEVKGQKEASEIFPDVASQIDKLAKRGIIHRNKAANLKSKLAKRVNSLAK
jgi:small subunit ribosomal protein S20